MGIARTDPPGGPERTAKAGWSWIGKYLIVIGAALVLGAVLAGLEPFRSATIGSARIGAGSLVRFIAHCGALALLWTLGYRHSAQLRQIGGRSAHLASTVLALVTLVVIALGYGVLLRFISPFLAQDLKPYLDWIFIVLILSAASWLLWALFADSEAWIEAIGLDVKRGTGRKARSTHGDDRARG